MRNLWWICWYLWEGLPTIFAFPIDPDRPAGTGDWWSLNWELKWPRYVIGTLGFVVVALTLAGCMCCRRQRRPKGFQDDAGNGKEFKDGSGTATETTIERVPSANLELEVSRIANSQSSISKVQFEALPVDRLVGEVRSAKPKPPSSSLFSEKAPERSNFSHDEPSRDWFAGNCHVPRERLKYLREIGRGWFGKVVEGTAEIPDNPEKKNRGVVVRILTEEATTSEKTWFLGEATPYLKLSHPNILTLLGCCLESDPYLLLFESCPAGDLKGFLRGNRDKGTCEALKKENVPTRIALDIANALQHMHDNGFAHTDLSARNCLVAPDLSGKLGDYGTGVEKYPGDYYVVGDRALPIRWSAPESLNCTETTIETRTITPRANLWSFAVLLWEIATWGERPFDDLGDEQVIEMIFSLKTSFFAQRTCQVLLKRLKEGDEWEASKSFREAVEASWKFLPEDRATLQECKEILGGKKIEDFEKRWENLKPNSANSGKEKDNRSASLQDLRGSVDEEIWEDKKPIQAQFRLGPEEPVKNLPITKNSSLPESGSETEEESWRGRVERGVYTEKVKQKSKSVADLMVLVHIDSDSDAEVSLGPQITEKTMKKRLPASGSDGDLRSHNFDDEFDQAIRKLRDNSVSNCTNVKTTKNHTDNWQFVDSIEKPKVMTLTHQGQTPILRLCFGMPENTDNSIFHDDRVKNCNQDTWKNNTEASSVEEKNPRGFDNVFKNEKTTTGKVEEKISSGSQKISTEATTEGPVLRLLSKGDPQLPVLSFVPEINSAPQATLNIEESSPFDSFLVFENPETEVADLSKNFKTSSSEKMSRGTEEDCLDVELWNNALAHELEKKNPGFDAHEKIFDESIDFHRKYDRESPKKSVSAPNTPKSVNFKLEENGRKDFIAASAPETPRKNDLPTKIDEQKSDSEPIIKEKISKNDAQETREKNLQEQIENTSCSEKINQCLGSFSAPEIDNQHAETCANVNRPLGSFSAPETPEKHYLEREETSSKVSYYSSSAPETPGNNYFASKTDEKSAKNRNFYAESLGSTSAPETPQFRGVYGTENLEDDSSASEKILRGSDTPQSRGNYSVGNGDEDSSTGDDIDKIIKRCSHEVDDEEERKHLSTPDDERSSDSGFRDKESCEEEESPVPCPSASSIISGGGISSSGLAADSSPLSASAEEEQMRILFELDTILDAEYYGTFRDSERLDDSEIFSPNSLQSRAIDSDIVSVKNRSVSESLESTESTEVVETVRANSCEPDFLDSRSLREIATLKEEENDGKIGGEELKKLGDLFKREPDDFDNFGDDTEADFLGDSASESLKNFDDFSGNVRKDSSDFSAKNESKSWDSSAELRKLNLDSSSDGKFDKSNESNDLSTEIRSSDVSDINKSKITDSDSGSPIKSEKNDAKDFLIVARTSSNETLQAQRKIENLEDLITTENSENNSSIENEKREKSSEVSNAFGESEKSTSNSFLKSEKNSGNSEICQVPAEFENSASDSPSKSERDIKSSEIIEASVELQNSSSNSPFKSENTNKTSEICQLSVELENSAPNSSLKSEKNSKTPEKCQVSTKVDKSFKTSEKSEFSTDFEDSSSNSASVSPKKISDPRKSSRKSDNSSSTSPAKTGDLEKMSEPSEASVELDNSASASPEKAPKPLENWETREASEMDMENSASESPIKTDRNQTSDLSMETRGPESVHSDVDQWSWRENINENENDDEDSSTMSLRSDNSYVSFGLDEEFVAAIRNELREKLPRAQMPVIETLDPRDETEPSINKDAESKRWEEEEEAEENAERGGGGVDIAIRYNIYGTPLSPILEERESAGTSESLVSKEDSREDASIASRVSALSEDVLVVDTRTNKAMMLEANSTGNGQEIEPQLDDDRDTSHGDFSDEENLEYPQNHLNRGLENKRISMGSGGAPLPSPEEETKWQQQFPLPLQMQDDLMSTSFGTDRDWDSQDDDEGEEGEDGEEDEEENSSSSGEFVWKRYDESHGDLENVATRSPPNKPKTHEPEADLEEEDEGEEDDDEEEEEEEFTPSAWDATLAPHRSALRSPEKTLKSGDQKKSVWFKKQRYHCVYEYPKETPVAEGQGQAATTWEPTSYADWEEMMDEPRLDVYPMEYDDSNRAGDEEFYVSSSNRPFQFQSGEGKYVSQFFPGASSTLLQQQQQQPQPQPEVSVVAAPEESQESQDEVDRVEAPSSPHFSQPNGNSRIPDFTETQQQQQQQQQQQKPLGELRHTRDRLKLNLLSTSGSSKAEEDVIDSRASETEITENPQSKTSKSSETITETLEDRENKIVSDISLGPRTKEPETSNVKTAPEKMVEKEKTLVDDFSTSENEKPANLAVKEAPEVAICHEQDGKDDLKDLKLICGDSSEENARKNKGAPEDDDFTVIQDEDEVLSAKNDSESIGEQKISSESSIISMSELTVEKIVDIPKLETEECPESAKKFEDEDRREVTNEEKNSLVRDEKTGKNVQSPKS